MPIECIFRKCCEELGIKVDFSYIGAMNLTLQPDWFCKERRTEHGGLYGIHVKGLSPDEIAKEINDKEEILQLVLYRDIKNKEPIAEINEVLLKYSSAAPTRAEAASKTKAAPSAKITKQFCETSVGSNPALTAKMSPA